MGRDDTRRAEDILSQTLRLTRAEREGYVRRRCGGDPSLYREVTRRLEAADEEATQRLEHEDGEADTPDGDPTGTLEAPTLERLELKIGDRLGPYELVSQLGEGGMGRVFLAEQALPVRRRVAIKVIKLGMDTREVLTRFESERNALAMMSHPNVAAALDAGTTETGRPFFVMEYVEGLPIHEYCDNHRMTVRERLQLAVQALEGIQHAHQKGIIHRDLKPNNILVTHRQHRPLAKIIDFGVAKSTDQKLVEDTFLTRFGVVLGTPSYMSPEQAGKNPLDVDTRSDVYSMGVLLYELLTGTQPFDAAELAELSLGELQRLIREEDPLRPSDRVAELEPTRIEKVAQRRQTDQKVLRRQLRGDLDWIVMKALAKDRNLRYPSAANMAEDIRRYLDGVPVEARPPSHWYRMRKFVGRHRLLVLLGSALALTLLTGLAVTGWALLEARQAQADARRQAAVTRATNAVLYELFVPDAQETADYAGTRSVDESIEVMLSRLDAGTAFQGPEFVEVAGSQTLAEVELALRNLVADRDAFLGRDERAAEQYRKAVELTRQLHGADSEAWFRSQLRLADHLAGVDPEAAVQRYQTVIDRGPGLLGAGSPVVRAAELGLATLRAGQGQPQRAHELLDQHASRSQPGDDAALELRLLTSLADLAAELGRYEQAMQAGTDALLLIWKHYGPRSVQAASAHLRLARYQPAGISQAAETHLAEALSILAVQDPYPIVAVTGARIDLARRLAARSAYAAAENELVGLLAELRITQAPRAIPMRVRALRALADLALQVEALDQALDWSRQAVAQARQWIQRPQPEGVSLAPLQAALVQFGRLEWLAGDARSALDHAREAGSMGPEGLTQAQALSILARADLGELEPAREAAATGVADRSTAWAVAAAGLLNGDAAAAEAGLAALEDLPGSGPWLALAEPPESADPLLALLAEWRRGAESPSVWEQAAWLRVARNVLRTAGLSAEAERLTGAAADSLTPPGPDRAGG